MKLVTKLARTGGSFGTARWTRHAVPEFSVRSICGQRILLKGIGVVEDTPSVQGDIHNCKRCMKLSADYLWEGKRRDS